MRHDDLILSHYIFSSDDDGNPVEDIHVGYDEKFNLIVLIEHTDYDFPEFNCCTYAIVDKTEAFNLAKRLKVSMTELPRIISDSIDDEYTELINPTLRQTRDCFKELLECFVDEKCRFKLVRNYAKHGYTCF